MKAITIVLGSALITAAALKAVPALAQPLPDRGEIAVSTVSTADLDLSTGTGLKVLERRLAHAVREVCGEASDVDVEGKNDIRKCRDETLAQARTQREAVLAAASRGSVIAVTAAR